MAAAIASFPERYVANFPEQVPVKMAQGVIASLAVNLFLGATGKVALLTAALAATATLIEAVTRPIIRAIFPEQPYIAKFIQITLPKVAVFGLAAVAAPWLGVSYQISTLIPLIAWITFNEGFYERNVAVTEVF